MASTTGVASGVVEMLKEDHKKVKELFEEFELAEGRERGQLESLLGEQSTAAIKDMIQRASQPSTGILATLVALATLLFGASGLFGQLQDSLNSIWGGGTENSRNLGHRSGPFFFLYGRTGNRFPATRVLGLERRPGGIGQVVWRMVASSRGCSPDVERTDLLHRHHCLVRHDV